MNLLAIDSAGSILSIAVSCGKNIFYKESETGSRSSESAMLIIDNVMTDASLKPDALNGVVCLSGPGSFTGLRIGYSIAKGLALSLSIPFTVVPTLDCMAYPFSNNNELILCAIEARKNAWYYSIYQNGISQSEIKTGGIEQINAENVRVIYKDRGYARELLEIGRTLDFSGNGGLFLGPEYFA
ncbi:MAG: tRNA (adenosine(37)-N6)-threonylcarbamoyltransferase complex dimerization subunit type 1 TsaB [Treponema sp.]|jgi:tRNA threonylcarbamoyladenosine biosynthesis protein TsaB|nr:tRNA (adenosine(37)-N6)-threonylcarbamoyltransferase complex dimerization subunit type 1 TsaB [Treponema sp.]